MQQHEHEHESKFFDFRRRRSVHVALYTDTFRELKKVMAERDLSFQLTFQRFSELVLSSDRGAMKIIDDLERDKRSGNIKKPRTNIDRRSATDIYDAIAEDSSLSETLSETEDENGHA